jgi:hypothetical protein
LCFQGSEAVVKKKQAQHQTEKMKENDLLWYTLKERRITGLLDIFYRPVF